MLVSNLWVRWRSHSSGGTIKMGSLGGMAHLLQLWVFLSACEDIETSQEYTVQDTFRYGFAERYKLKNEIAQPTTGTFSVTTTKLQAQIPIRNSPVVVAIEAMGKLGPPEQFQPSDHQSFPELLQSEVEDVISALVENFKIPRDKIKPEHLQTFVFSHCRPF